MFQNILNFPFPLTLSSQSYTISKPVTILTSTDLPGFPLIRKNLYNRTVEKRNLKLFASKNPLFPNRSFFLSRRTQREREREGDSLVALWWPVAEVVVKLVRSRLCNTGAG